MSPASASSIQEEISSLFKLFSLPEIQVSKRKGERGKERKRSGERERNIHTQQERNGEDMDTINIFVCWTKRNERCSTSNPGSIIPWTAELRTEPNYPGQTQTEQLKSSTCITRSNAANFNHLLQYYYYCYGIFYSVHGLPYSRRKNFFLLCFCQYLHVHRNP